MRVFSFPGFPLVGHWTSSSLAQLHINTWPGSFNLVTCPYSLPLVQLSICLQNYWWLSIGEIWKQLNRHLKCNCNVVLQMRSHCIHTHTHWLDSSTLLLPNGHCVHIASTNRNGYGSPRLRQKSGNVLTRKGTIMIMFQFQVTFIGLLDKFESHCKFKALYRVKLQRCYH